MLPHKFKGVRELSCKNIKLDEPHRFTEATASELSQGPLGQAGRVGIAGPFLGVRQRNAFSLGPAASLLMDISHSSNKNICRSQASKLTHV